MRSRRARGFTSMFRHLGALGLFFLAILDSTPLPTFGGPDILIAILAGSHRNPWYEYAAVATAGSVIGAYLHIPPRPQSRIGLSEQQIWTRQSVRVPASYFRNGVPERWWPLPPFLSRSRPAMVFAAAGASDYRMGKYLPIVAVCRAARYSAIAIVADLYGRHFIRVIRHPVQYWGWLLLFFAAVSA